MKPDHTAEEPAVAYNQTITSFEQLDFKTLLFRWKLQERVELFKGLVYKMSPAPSPAHQKPGLGLTLKVGNYFKGKPCQVFPAPFDVRLPDSKKQTDDSQVFTD